MDTDKIYNDLEKKGFKIGPDDTIQIGHKHYKYSDVVRINDEVIAEVGGIKGRDTVHSSFFIFWDEIMQYTGYSFYEYLRTVYQGADFDGYRELMIPLTFEVYATRLYSDPLYLILDDILPITEEVSQLSEEDQKKFMDLRYQKYMWLDNIYKKLYQYDYLFLNAPLGRIFRDFLSLNTAMTAITICFKYHSTYIEPLMDSIKEWVGTYRRQADLEPVLVTHTVFNVEYQQDAIEYVERLQKIVEGHEVIMTQNVNTFLSVVLNAGIPHRSIYGPPEHNGMDDAAKVLAANVLDGDLEWPFDMELIIASDQVIDPEETSSLMGMPTKKKDDAVIESGNSGYEGDF